MTDVYEYHHGSVLAVMDVPREETSKYGIVSSDKLDDKIQKVTGIIEKPKPEEAPTTLASVGRYILSPTIFKMIKTVGTGAGGEIQLTDAIDALLKIEAVYALEFEGKRYDCGSKLGYLQATVELALQHPELQDDFKDYLAGLK